MLNKIDSRLLSKINILSNDKLIDVVVMTNDLSYSRRVLQEYCDALIELPIISSLAFSTKIENVFNIARQDCVTFISLSTKVCGLIYDSKKYIGVDSLPKGSIKREHSCVVVDTGIYPHIDFCLGKNRIIGFVDLINDKQRPYDDNGHGTFVSGILCANSITDKYSGIDNSCNIIVIKALDKDGETSTITILKAMQWILDNREKYNIKVVCMSFGSQLVDKKDPLMFGAEVLWDNGVVVVSACGNGGPDEATVMSPGASKKIITVGSMEKNGNTFRVADFSSRGPVFNYYKPDLLTPGVNIISTKVFENKEFYTRMSGTSVSAPMVAGVASLLFNVNHNYTPNQIKHMIINSCTPLSRDRNEEGFGALNLTNLKLI